MTTPPWWTEKVMVYYLINLFELNFDLVCKVQDLVHYFHGKEGIINAVCMCCTSQLVG